VTDWADRKLHFIGIGGAGMSGLALVCHQRGARVSGSDRAESSYVQRLREAGLEPAIGHDPQNLPADADVVVSTAVVEENPELALARERGQRVLHRGELLAELCAEKRLIAIAGTHGKTSTTAMVIWALRAAGEDPAFFLGGELPGAGTAGDDANAGWGEGEWVVAEADESDASFLRLNPEVAAITNVEMDHHSRWGSVAELTEAFRDFAAPAHTVVLGPGAGGVAAALEQEPIHFNLDSPGPPWLELAVPGRHNILNARAALACLEAAGHDAATAAEALADFPGVRRRLELKGTHRGALVYDDYAHHPTEVGAALAALRELGPERLIAVFQPHLYSRTKALAEQFGAALSEADEVGVLEVYPSREKPEGELAEVSGLQVAVAVADRNSGRPVWWLVDADRAHAALAPRLGEGDLVVTIGAGDITLLARRLAGEGGPSGSDGEGGKGR
jgi:UDP-N-acetylmuramate--alanine ligase